MSPEKPYFNMVEYNEEKLKIVKSLGESIVRRQDVKKVYDHVASIYVLNPNYLVLKIFIWESRRL